MLELFDLIRHSLARHQVHYSVPPRLAEFRPGDVRHSLADIKKAARMLGYDPTHTVAQGMEAAVPWYLKFFSATGRAGEDALGGC